MLVKVTRRQLQIIKEELELNQGQMIDIIASFDAEGAESVNRGEMINLLSSMPDDDRNEFIRVAISSNDPDIDVAAGDLDDYTTESIVDLVGKGTLRFDTQSLASWMDQIASRIGSSMEDISGKMHTGSSSGESDTSRGQVSVILGKGDACNTYKSLSASQVKETFKSREYSDREWDGHKLTMISCYATGGSILSAYDLAGIIDDPESNLSVSEKLSALGPGIRSWIIEKQNEPVRESSMKITRKQLKQIIKEAISLDVDYLDSIGSQEMADAKRAAGEDPAAQAAHLGIGVEDWYTIRQELDDHYEDRHMEDQMAFDDDPDMDNDGMLSVGELVKMTQNIADDVNESNAQEGTELSQMPDSWRQILGNCLD
jgi:Ca2+-binding EF-hand superfamily protein